MTNTQKQPITKRIIEHHTICNNLLEWISTVLESKFSMCPPAKNTIKKENDDIGLRVNKFGILYSNVFTSYLIKGSGNVLSNRYESESEVAQSCPTLCDPMDISLHQAPPSMGFSRQEYWSGLLFPSPGNLPDPGIKPRPPAL